MSRSSLPVTEPIPAINQPTADAAASDWLSRARSALASGKPVDDAMLNELEAALAGRTKVRQRLLYMHLTTPAPHASAVSCTIFDPAAEVRNQLSAESPQLAYNSVVEAMADGWQVISFPDINAPIDDREVDMLGYLFILQKMEVYGD